MVSLPVCLAHADRPDIRNGLISCQPASLNLGFNLAQLGLQPRSIQSPDFNMAQSRLKHGSIQQWQTHSGEVIIKWKEPKGFELDVNCDNLKCNSMWLSDHNHSSYSSIIGQCFQLPRLKHQKRSRSWYDPQPGISVEQVIRGAGCYRYQNQKLCTFQRRTIIVRLKTSQRTWRIISCTGSM